MKHRAKCHQPFSQRGDNTDDLVRVEDGEIVSLEATDEGHVIVERDSGETIRILDPQVMIPLLFEPTGAQG